MAQYTEYDQNTGQIKAIYTKKILPGYEDLGWEYVNSRTDFDLYNEYDWLSYTVRKTAYAYGQLEIASTDTLMDDGSSKLVEYEYRGGLGNSPRLVMTKITLKDDEGRIASIEQKYTGVVLPGGQTSVVVNEVWDINPVTGRIEQHTVNYFSGKSYVVTTTLDGALRADDYDSAGHLDYVVDKRPDGRQIASDYNPETGLLDYVITTRPDGYMRADDYDAAGRLDYVIEKNPDGTQIALDYNPETGLLDFVITTSPDGSLRADDYDAAGRLDYVIEKSLDGRITATDYDLADEYAWTVATIIYNAAGQTESMTLL
ncbi:hypothetical protein ACFQU7_36675 [Pseudoroseomonas wenyumeiae]